MAEWKTTKIGEVAEIYDGPHATPTKTQTGPWFLSISSLDNGRLNIDESAHLSEEGFVRWTRRVTPSGGDVLFSYETRLGDAALMPNGIRACLGRRMGLLRPRSDKVDSRFLLYAYLAPGFQEVIRQRSIHGATVDRIPLNELGTWPIALPPLYEQRAIAAVLGALDDKIATNDTMARTADKLVRLSYEENALEAHRTTEIGDLGELIRETVPAYQLVDEESYIALEHMPRRNMWLHEWGSSTLVTSAKSRFRTGDVLFGKLRPYFHKVGVAFVDGICSTDILVVRPKRDAFRGWLLAMLSSDEVVAYASAIADGTRMPRARWGDLAIYKVPWIGDDAAARFNDVVTPLAHRIRSAVTENRTLAELRDTLLPKLMSGELRVRDAEKVVEEAT